MTEGLALVILIGFVLFPSFGGKIIADVVKAYQKNMQEPRHDR